MPYNGISTVADSCSVMRVGHHAALAQHSTSHAHSNVQVAEEVHPIATLRPSNVGASKNQTAEDLSLELRHPRHRLTPLKRLLRFRLIPRTNKYRQRASVRLKRSPSLSMISSPTFTIFALSLTNPAFARHGNDVRTCLTSHFSPFLHQ